MTYFCIFIGLDTDFHNQNVVFPSTIVCPEIPFDHDKAYDWAYRTLSWVDTDYETRSESLRNANYFFSNRNYDHPTATMITPFLELLTSLNFDNVNEAYALSTSVSPNILKEINLREAVFKVRFSSQRNTKLQIYSFWFRFCSGSCKLRRHLNRMQVPRWAHIVLHTLR